MEQQQPWWRQRVIIACAALTLVLIAGFGIWLVTRSTAAVGTAATDAFVASDMLTEGGTDTPPVEAQPGIIVYISGEVRAPDVYVLPAEARVKDLIVAAGGLTDAADPGKINLAERLKDEQHVLVPQQTSADDVPVTAGAASEQVDLNSASQTDLEGIDGIGAVTAQRIIEYRTQHGPFSRIEDLREISGIGAAKFTTIAPHVIVAR